MRFEHGDDNIVCMDAGSIFLEVTECFAAFCFCVSRSVDPAWSNCFRVRRRCDYRCKVVYRHALGSKEESHGQTSAVLNVL